MTLGAQNSEIQEGIDQLFSKILLEQEKINAVKGPEPGKENLVKEKLAEYEKLRGKGFFFNYFSSGKGSGPFTELIDGSVKYDMIGGIGPNLLGHAHPAYLKAALEAATVDTMMCGNLQTYSAPCELTETLLNTVKKSNLKHFWFSGSGSFANDVALKIIWQKTAPKYDIIAFNKAFAGRSVATQEITHNESYREGMPTFINVHHVPHFDQSDPENATQKTIDALEQTYKEHGEKIGGMIIELVQGEGGFIYGPKDYYETIFKWAKAKGIYIWADEVQTFGRTRELFSFQMYGLDEYIDVVTIAKVLQGAGTFYTEELNPKPGLIAGTFNGSIPALMAGKKVVDLLTEGGFFGIKGRNAHLECEFQGRLINLMNNSCKGKITYVGGVGTMLAFEVGDSGKEVTTKFVKKLYDNGVISFFAGKNPTRVRFLFPITLTDKHLDEITSIVEKTCHEIL